MCCLEVARKQVHGGNAILTNNKNIIQVVALNTYKIPVSQLLYSAFGKALCTYKVFFFNKAPLFSEHYEITIYCQGLISNLILS